MSLIDLVEFHSFMSRNIGSSSVVLDLGANLGNFSRKMKHRHGVVCIGAEASPQIFQELKKNDSLKSYNIALHDHVGTVELNLSADILSSSIFDASTHSVNGTTSVLCMDLESFAIHAGVAQIDLLKVDIEGAEIPMLAACSDDFLRKIPQITIEFHDFCGITPASEVTDCLTRMKALGFDVIRFSRVGHQDTLLVNRALVSVSKAEFLYVKYIYRNLKGAVRVCASLQRAIDGPTTIAEGTLREVRDVLNSRRDTRSHILLSL